MENERGCQVNAHEVFTRETRLLKCFDENIILLRNLNIDVEHLGDCCRGYK